MSEHLSIESIEEEEEIAKIISRKKRERGETPQVGQQSDAKKLKVEKVGTSALLQQAVDQKRVLRELREKKKLQELIQARGKKIQQLQDELDTPTAGNEMLVPNTQVDDQQSLLIDKENSEGEDQEEIEKRAQKFYKEYVTVKEQDVSNTTQKQRLVEFLPDNLEVALNFLNRNFEGRGGHKELPDKVNKQLTQVFNYIGKSTAVLTQFDTPSLTSKALSEEAAFVTMIGKNIEALVACYDDVIPPLCVVFLRGLLKLLKDRTSFLWSIEHHGSRTAEYLRQTNSDFHNMDLALKGQQLTAQKQGRTQFGINRYAAQGNKAAGSRFYSQQRQQRSRQWNQQDYNRGGLGSRHQTAASTNNKGPF